MLAIWQEVVGMQNRDVVNFDSFLKDKRLQKIILATCDMKEEVDVRMHYFDLYMILYVFEKNNVLKQDKQDEVTE